MSYANEERTIRSALRSLLLEQDKFDSMVKGSPEYYEKAHAYMRKLLKYVSLRGSMYDIPYLRNMLVVPDLPEIPTLILRYWQNHSPVMRRFLEEEVDI